MLQQKLVVNGDSERNGDIFKIVSILLMMLN